MALEKAGKMVEEQDQELLCERELEEVQVGLMGDIEALRLCYEDEHAHKGGNPMNVRELLEIERKSLIAL